ncbi:MAG TPA: carboxypeptidase-like regulatory domain-containing protein, partial [Bacteroidales bacterium]
QDGKPLSGATVIVRGTTIGTITDSKGLFAINNVPEEGSIVVSYVGFESKVIKIDFTSQMNIKMMKATVATDKVVTNPPPPPPQSPLPPLPPPPPPLSPPPPPTTTPPGSLSSVLDIRSADGEMPLIIVDGIVTDIKIDKIDPNTVKSIHVLNESSAVAKYGDKGKDGVLEIILKKGVSDNPSGQKSEVRVRSNAVKNYDQPQPGVRIRGNGLNNAGSPPIIIVDGVERGTNLSELNISPDEIENISVNKNESSTKLYGEKAKNGVILIITKKKLN